MRLIQFLPVLMVLVAGQIPVLASSVSLTICNGGKVDIDPYLVQGATVSTKHIPPAQCMQLVESESRMPDGYLGFGFTDAKGQWGGARRYDRIPNDVSPLDPSGGIVAVLERVNRSLTVKHGAANATIPGLLVFHPPAPPVCISTPAPASSYESHLPIGASQSAVNQARTLDRMNVTHPGADSGGTTCGGLNYKLTVIPYADSREVSLDTRCDSCTANEEPARTPEEQARYEQVSGAIERQMRQLAGTFGALGRSAERMVDDVNSTERQEKARRAEIAKGPYQMNWKDLPSFMTSAYNAKGPLMLNRHIILRGTILRAYTPDSGRGSDSVNIYFQEGSSMGKPLDRLAGDYFVNGHLGTDRTFAVCTYETGILSEVFGANYATAMVGKTVELEGELNRNSCEAAAGVRLLLARQVRVVTPALALARGQTWTPVLQPVAATQPAPPAQPSPATPRGETRGATRSASAPGPAVSRRQAPAASAPAASAPPPAPVTTASVSPPAPVVQAVPAAPAPQAAPVKDPIVDNVIQYLKARMTEAQILVVLQGQNKKHELTGADRGRLEDAGASEKLIEALIDPASIGTLPLDRSAAAAAARQNVQSQRERLANCQAQANREFPRDAAARAKVLNACMSK